MKSLTAFAWILAAVALTACGKTAVDLEPTGSLRMALEGQGPAGEIYRLRSGLFGISGPTQLSLDSESNPSAAILSTQLPAGTYQVSLNDGWYMERVANGQVVAVDAALQSANPQQAVLTSAGTSDVLFVFAVNNLPVVFAPATLTVGIEVVECDGSPGQWEGCRGNGCAVCTEQLVDFPRYLQNHPRCTPNPTCDGALFTCNDRCPAPIDADRADGAMCNGTAGEWAGCRGNGCAVCAEQLQGYTRYVQNHPRCVVNPTCDGQFFTCNADCPAPTMADL